MQALLSLDHFPAGMELFPASDDDQWELIKGVIDDSDYYVIVIAARYGSMSAEGLSYTEMEFDYAVEQGIPILAFLHQSPEELPAKKTDQNDKARRKLGSLRKKVTIGRHVKFWKSADDLRAKAIQAISAETKRNPRVGWIRANRAMSQEDRQRELRLQDDLIAAKALIEELEREIRDRSVLAPDVPRERLSQGTDLFHFTVTFKSETSRLVVEQLPVAWDDLFKVIGPSMYGYILRKNDNYRGSREYPFHGNLESLLRSKLIDRCQGRKIEILESDIDTCILQLKELGLLMFNNKQNKDGSVFRGITLTETGERRLLLLKAVLKASN